MASQGTQFDPKDPYILQLINKGFEKMGLRVNQSSKSWEFVNGDGSVVPGGGLSQATLDARYPRSYTLPSFAPDQTGGIAWLDPAMAYKVAAMGSGNGASADGDPIGALYDLFGGGPLGVSNSFTWDGTGTAPTLGVGANGLSGLPMHVGSTTARLKSPSSFGSRLTGGFTWFVVSSRGNGSGHILSNGNNFGLKDGGSVAGNGLTTLNPKGTTPYPSVYCVCYDALALTLTLSVNGVEVVQQLSSPIPSANLNGTYAIGDIPAGGVPYNGKIGTLYAYNSALSSSSRARIMAGLQTKYAASIDAIPMVMGNSFVSGFNMSDPAKYLPAQIYRDLGLASSYTDGTTGIATQNLNVLSHLNPLTGYLSPSRRKKVLVIIEGTNQLTTTASGGIGDSPAGAYAQMVALVNACKALDSALKVYVTSVVPRVESNGGAGFNAKAVTYNSLLYGANGPWDGVIPWDKHPLFNNFDASAGSYTGAAYSDGIHPSQEIGSPILAKIVSDTVRPEFL